MQKAYIICYHRVSDNDDSYLRPTKISDFEKQMEYISKVYNPMPLEKIINFIKNKEELPKKLIAVTFDDVYKDNYINAYPILKKFNIPATIFLTTNYIDTNKVFFWDKIYFIISKIKNKKLILSFFGNCISNVKNKVRIAHNIIEQFKALSEEEREKFLYEIIEKLGMQNMYENLYNNGIMLSWNDAKEMSENGISFGSHTHTHPLLTNISPDKVYEELIISKEIVQHHTKKNEIVLAYPSGDFNSTTKEIAKKAKYLAAVSTICGYNNLKTDIFELRRNAIGTPGFMQFASSYLLTFKSELVGTTAFLRKLYNKMR